MSESEESVKKLPVWVFLLADAILLATAWWIMTNSPHPLPIGHVLALTACVAAGAWCSILPFLKVYETEHRLTEFQSLASSLQQIKKVENVARRIEETTRQWEYLKEESDKSLEASKGVFDRMAEETKAFHAFLENSQQTQINNLKLETEKLRRSENEWLQLCVHILDHVHALYAAAIKSGNERVAQQLTQFRAAVYDATRRVGLSPFVAEPDEPFDSRKFQLKDAREEPPVGSVVADTIATGFTFQGQLLRRAMVAVKQPSVEELEQSEGDTVRIIPPSLGEDLSEDAPVNLEEAPVESGSIPAQPPSADEEAEDAANQDESSEALKEDISSDESGEEFPPSEQRLL